MRPRFIQVGSKVGGERRPRGAQNEALVSPSWCVVEASWGQVGAKMKQQWSPNADTIVRGRRKDGANASPSSADLETQWGQVGVKTKRRWTQHRSGTESAKQQECQNSMIKHTLLAIRRGGELRNKWCQDGTHGGAVGPQSRPT